MATMIKLTVTITADAEKLKKQINALVQGGKKEYVNAFIQIAEKIRDEDIMPGVDVEIIETGGLF
jgi:ribosomal protein L17